MFNSFFVVFWSVVDFPLVGLELVAASVQSSFKLGSDVNVSVNRCKCTCRCSFLILSPVAAFTPGYSAAAGSPGRQQQEPRLCQSWNRRSPVGGGRDRSFWICRCVLRIRIQNPDPGSSLCAVFPLTRRNRHRTHSPGGLQHAAAAAPAERGLPADWLL